MKQKKNKGITLIALVITIIVLLILVGVSIATLTGENGILNKAMKVSEESKIEQYKEEINLIIMDEIAERKVKNKEEAFIVSLETKIQEKEWVKETIKCNENGIEQPEIKENNRLIVNTKDGYEIIIEVDNIGLVAKIIEINKTGEGKTTLEMSITDEKITEGTNISIKIASMEKIQKIEVKVKDIILYAQDNVINTFYAKELGIDQLSNLGQLPFYDDMTVTLEVTRLTGTKEVTSIEKVKNYTVSTKEQLNQLANVVNNGNSLQNEIIVQLADIDINPGKWTENGEGAVTFKNNPTEWKVIGVETYDYASNSFSNVKAFAGTFDGKNHKIEGIYINNKEKDAVGLFSRNEGMIKNIILKNSKIKGRYMVGGIASANSEQGIIENCENYASVSGARCIGGISSWSTGNLRNNINFGQISNAVETGWNLQIEQIGGITGWGENSITQCENYGEIRSITTNVNTTQKGVGGIIGSGYSGEVKKCNNFANVSGSGSNASGIIGFAANKAGENFIVSKCYNTGNISGAFAGGISGWSSYMQIQDCYNVGEIKGSSHTGGIIGWTSQKGSIINSYNIGKVTGTPTNLVGGILGRYNNVPTLTNCYNLNTSSAYAIGDDNGAWGTLDNIWEGHVETKTEEGMKGLADTLGSSWIDDIDNVNNGYPVLK